MQELRLVAVSEDGSYLVLATAGRGTRFTLPIDDRLRAVVRGHFSRLGQYEIEVESPLRPKEIQARIRAGETAEEIAETAGIPVERVRWFEGPVLQEREYMAQQAQRVTIRRPGEPSPGPTLGEIVEERLGRRGIDLDEVEWDSRKCEDSTWRVSLVFSYDGRLYAAEWSYDPRRRNISAVNDEATRLSSLDLDDTADDTVTPFLPRRAMKIVADPPREQPAPPPVPVPAPRYHDAPPAAERAIVREVPATMPEEPTPSREIAARQAIAVREATAPREPAPGTAISPDTGTTTPEGPSTAEPTGDGVPAARPGSEAETAAHSAGTAERRDDHERPVAAPATGPEQAERKAAPRPAEPGFPEDEAEREPAAQAASDEPAERSTAEAESKREAESAERASVVAKPAPSKPKAAPAKAAPPKPAPPKPAAPRPTAPEPAARKPAEQPAEPVTERPAMAAATAAPPTTPDKRPAARKKARGKRASVPSWDEIMFGARRPE